MFAIFTFYISGALIVALLVLKHIEITKREKPRVLEIISSKDSHLRLLHKNILLKYLDLKKDVSFFFSKQVPLYTRNKLNKLFTLMRTEMRKRVSNIRDSKLLKRSDGISEFFKNISEIEKGNGATNETYEGEGPKIVDSIR